MIPIYSKKIILPELRVYASGKSWKTEENSEKQEFWLIEMGFQIHVDRELIFLNLVIIWQYVCPSTRNLEKIFDFVYRKTSKNGSDTKKATLQLIEMDFLGHFEVKVNF